MTRTRALVAPLGGLSPRRELTMVLLILAETMIVYIYAGVLLSEMEPPFHPLPATLIFTVLLIAYQLPHILETTRLWSPEYETIMMAGLVGSLLLVLKVAAFPDAAWFSLSWLSGSLDALILRPSEAVRPVWGLVLLTAYAWWRGRSRGEPVLDTTYAMMRWGIVFVAGGLILIWVSTPPGAAIAEWSGAAVIGFIVFGLLAIAVARQPTSADAPGWNRTWIWLAVFVLPIVAIAATTVSTAGVLSRDTLDVLLAILSPVFWVIGLALRAIILLIAVATFILIVPILWFIDRQNFGPFANIPRIDLAPRTTGDMNDFARTTLDIADPVRFLIAGVILTMLGWILVRFLYRRRKHYQESRRQQRESLIDWEEQPATLLRRAGQWIWARVGGRRSGRVRIATPWETNRRVRRAYRAFLRQARRFAREPGHQVAGEARAQRRVQRQCLAFRDVEVRGAGDRIEQMQIIRCHAVRDQRL
jgi:hypothetical protein